MKINASSFMNDVGASLGVVLVAIPLCLGIALASGVPPAAGLVAGMIGGILVGLLSGAPLVVSGPAAGLVSLAVHYRIQYGVESLLYITMIAGMFQAIFALCRVGHWFTKVPKPVLYGMLAAIGFTIASYQMHGLLGQPIPSSLSQAYGQLPTAVNAAFSATTEWFPPVVFWGLMAIAIQILWPLLPKKISKIPAVLPAVIVVTAGALSHAMPRIEIEALHVLAKESMELVNGLTIPSDPYPLFAAGLALALVASAESLLTARALSDLLPPGARKTQLNRELFAQGVGNMASGALGGLPITGVIVRSAANIEFGAKSRWSTVMHGAWIALLLAFGVELLRMIPLTALAGVLIVTGVKLLQVKNLAKLLRTAPHDAFITVATFAAILATHLLNGLIIGLVLAVGLKWWRRREAKGAGLHLIDDSTH